MQYEGTHVLPTASTWFARCCRYMRQGSNPRRRSYCRWYCNLVLVLLRYGYTHAPKTCADYGTCKDTAACAGPNFGPAHRDRAQSPGNTIRRKNTAAGARNHGKRVLSRPLWQRLSECPSGNSGLPLYRARNHSASLDKSRQACV